MFNNAQQQLGASASSSSSNPTGPGQAQAQVQASLKSLLDGKVFGEVWNLIRTSPTFAAASMFPSVSADPIEKEDRRQQQPSAAKTLQKNPAVRIGAFASSARRGASALSPLRLTRHEAKHKRRELQRRREELAEQIGRLAAALDRPAGGQDVAADLRELGSSLGSSSDAGSVEGLRTLLQTTLPKHEISNVFHTSLAASPVGLGPPSTLARLWPTFIIVPASTLLLIRIVSRNRDAIAESIRNARETVRGFFVGWVYEPAMRLLDTVRHGEANSALIISRESLNSDLQSLERMVVDFSKEKYSLSPSELDAVAARVKEGDLTHVLKVYESEMKKPLKGAISGSLIRTLLIQIQKAKVDLEVAMSGIDSLLKSQQLLFGAVGIAPAMGILYVSLSWVRSRFRSAADRRGRVSGYDYRVRAWEAMRRIDRLLAAVPGQGSLGGESTNDAKTHGLLLLDLALLRAAAAPLIAGAASASGRKGVRRSLQAHFLEDVRELETLQRRNAPSSLSGSVADVGLVWHSRRATLDRMWRSFGPLFALHV